jgi:hypothetical protein
MMADKFKVGDKARLTDKKCPRGVHVEHELAYLIGSSGVITRGAENDSGFLRYEMLVEGKIIQPLEEALELVDDGSVKSSWSECAWKPKELCKPK